MNTKHTPGPWFAENIDADGLFPSVRIGAPVPYKDGSGFYDGRITVNACSPGADIGVHRANAQLISAAPDMAEALQGLVAFADMGGLEGPTANIELAFAYVAAARMALAKAGL